MRAVDLAGRHLSIKRSADPRQGDLFAGKASPRVMNVVSWRGAAADVAILRQAPERSRLGLRVIDGGRTDLMTDIKQLAEELRELGLRVASAREELGRLLALLGGC